jgi:hypothetical protein
VEINRVLCVILYVATVSALRQASRRARSPIMHIPIWKANYLVGI